MANSTIGWVPCEELTSLTEDELTRLVDIPDSLQWIGKAFAQRIVALSLHIVESKKGTGITECSLSVGVLKDGVPWGKAVFLLTNKSLCYLTVEKYKGLTIKFAPVSIREWTHPTAQEEPAHVD